MSEDEDGPYFDRLIRTIKEKARMVFALLPFKSISRRLTIELVYSQIFWYYYTISQNYIFTNMSLRTFILERVYAYNKICGPDSMFG